MKNLQNESGDRLIGKIPSVIDESFFKANMSIQKKTIEIDSDSSNTNINEEFDKNSALKGKYLDEQKDKLYHDLPIFSQERIQQSNDTVENLGTHYGLSTFK